MEKLHVLLGAIFSKITDLEIKLVLYSTWFSGNNFKNCIIRSE